MFRKVAIIGLLVMALVPGRGGASPADNPRLHQLTVGDGLPSNRVEALAEDRGGHLWIGTRDGLARYDGVGFRLWRKEDGLPDNEVADLHVDGQDRVWVATSGGLAVLDRARNGFRLYTTDTVAALESNIIWSVTGTPDGAIWFGTATSGLYRIDPGGRMQRFLPDADDPRSLPSAAIPLLVTAEDGTLWIGTRNGLVRWTGRDFEPVRGVPPEAVLLGLAPMADGRVWVGLPQGMELVDPAGGLSTALPWPQDGATGRLYKVLLRDRSGTYWIDASGGLAMAGESMAGESMAGESWISRVRTYSDLHQGAVTPDWSVAHEDREGGLWLGSVDSGLWYLPPTWRQFQVLQYSEGVPGSLANPDVTAMAPSADGSMWLIGNGGVLERLDPVSGAVEPIMHAEGDYVPDRLFEDDAGNVWFCFHGGLGRYVPASDALRVWHAEDAAEAASPDDCLTVLQAAGGLVWSVSAYHGVQARDWEGALLETVLPGGDSGLLPGARLEHAQRAPDGGLWVAGEQGLLMWNAGARAFQPVPGAPAEPTGAFVLQGRDRAWLTRSGVLESYRWDGVSLARELRLGPEDGLPDLAFLGLTVDAAGVVWLASARGLVRVEPALRRVHVFGVSHGLPAQDMTTAPVPGPADGRIHFATGAGLVIFDPALVRPDDTMPALAIKAIEVRGRGGVRQLELDRPLRLGYRDHEMRVRARVAGFNSARHNRYRFFLHGYDSAWVESDAAGERVFPALDPGRYRLEVMGRTPLSPWSEPTSFMLEVAAPWWWTRQAQAAWVLAAVLLGAWALHAVRRKVRRRLAWRRVEHERELARQASDAKTRFLATLGHEVRTPMTGVLGMSELLLRTTLDPRQRGYTEAIHRAGEHLMKLVNDALDLARVEAGRLELDPQPFNPRALVEEVGALMAPLARQRGLAYRGEVADDVPAGLCGDEVRIRQILLNLVGNAIKFTEQGRVELIMQALDGGGIRVIVSDTGPGLNAEQRQRLFQRFEQAEGGRTAARYGGSGLGLAICQELAAQMQGGITVDSTPGQGSDFVVTLPLPAVEAPVARADEPVAPADPVAPASGVRILLVEDDPTVAEVISALLAAQGYVPTRVGHGLAALAEVRRQEYAVALLDLDLPGIDGLALARQLRAQGWKGALVAITARADGAVEGAVQEAGFDAFLRKPVSGKVLAGQIARVLERQPHAADVPA